MSEPDLALAGGDYLLLTWLFDLPREVALEAGGSGGDMMGSVIRPAGWRDGDWRVRWRFRYYRDDKAFGSRDRKNWSGSVFRGQTEAEAEASIRAFLEVIILATSGEFAAEITPEVFVVRGDHNKLQAMLAAGEGPTWMHGREPGR